MGDSRSAPESRVLTGPQRRHLAEMVNEEGLTRYWHPANSGERRCARALKVMGLLDGSDLSYNDGFYLSADGLSVARALTTGDSGALPDSPTACPPEEEK